MKKPIGVVGVGHLMRHLTPGLMRAETKPRLLLSPRNAATAKDIANRFGCEIASDNRTIVERSDLVILAVRPFQVEQALKGLPWRKSHTIVSMVAGISVAATETHSKPARVVRAMPVTAAEFGESPTCLYPNDEAVAALLRPAGRVIALSSEDQFEPASVIACHYGWVQKLTAEMTTWLQAKGMDPAPARELTAAMTRAASTTVLERPSDSLESLISELCLPGSYTGQGLEVLRKADAFAPWHDAADALLARMRHGKS